MPSYKGAVKETWRPLSLESTQQSTKYARMPQSLLKEIVRYATLAPSSHNTQCWKFKADDGGHFITILPDLERRCPVVDPDDHHLYVSLGGAVENLVIAALANGFEAIVDSSDPSHGIKINFEACKPRITTRFDAIPHRKISRTEYDGEPLLESELERLQAATDESLGQVQLVLLTDPDSMEMARSHICRANAAQVENKLFRDELEEWIRFSENESVEKADGLASPCVGSPFAPARWIGKSIFRWTFKANAENDKIMKQIESSAGIAIFVSKEDDEAHWVETGRAYERFALDATTMGIRTAMLNQPVEEADKRPEFASAFKLKGRPDLIVRFGKGGRDLPHSLRRPVEEVLQ